MINRTGKKGRFGLYRRFSRVSALKVGKTQHYIDLAESLTEGNLRDYHAFSRLFKEKYR
ncbi:hypothetical protein [Thiomicrorhabdus hydrogeniphila]